MRSARRTLLACLSSLALCTVAGAAFAQDELSHASPAEPPAAAKPTADKAAAGKPVAEPAAAGKPASAKQVMLFGSSSMNDHFGGLLESALDKRGLKVTRKGVPAAGFSRPDYRDVTAILGKTKLENVSGIVVYLGMNDAQAIFLHPAEREQPNKARVQFDQEQAWSAAYEARAKAFFQGTCDRGVKKIAVLLPVDVVSKKMQQRLDRIRTLQRNAAAASTCAVAVETGGDTARFATEKNTLRVEDGVHMTQAGSKAVWERVKGQVLALLEE